MNFTMRMRGCSLALTVTMGFWAGCASTRIRPDDMSAGAHRKVAARARGAAAVSRKAYDESADVTQVIVAVNAVATSEAAVMRTTSNPTDYHLHDAAVHSSHAKAHEKAASALEAFEAKECERYSKAARASCPLIGPITRVEDILFGVRLFPNEGAVVADVVGLMRCHYAFAQVHGFKDGFTCPLYIKGLKIQESADGRAIELVSDTPSVAFEIQQRSHAEFTRGSGHGRSL